VRAFVGELTETMSRFQESAAGRTPRCGAVRLAGCAVLTFAAASAWAGAASAQLAEKIGVQARLRVEYDDNIARRSDNVLRRGLSSKDDIIYTPNLGLNFQQPVGRFSTTLRGTLGYKFHQYNTSLNSEVISLSAAGNGTFGRCALAPSANYSRQQSNLDDVPLGAPENISINTAVGLSTTCRVGRLAPSVSVQKSWTRNESNLGADSETLSVSGSVGYGNAALGSISLVGTYTETENQNRFTSNILGPLLLDAGYKMRSVGVNYSRPFGARLTGTAGMQYYWLTSRFSGDDHGISGNAGLTYRVGPRLNLALMASRSVRPPTQVFATRSIDESVDLAATYKMSSRVTLNAGVAQLNRSYTTLLTPTLLGPSDEKRRSFRAGAQFSVGDKTSLTLDYIHDNNNSDAPGFDYTSNRVALTAARYF